MFLGGGVFALPHSLIATSMMALVAGVLFLVVRQQGTRRLPGAAVDGRPGVLAPASDALTRRN